MSIYICPDPGCPGDRYLAEAETASIAERSARRRLLGATLGSRNLKTAVIVAIGGAKETTT